MATNAWPAPTGPQYPRAGDDERAPIVNWATALGFDPTDYTSWPYGFGDPEGDVWEADEYGEAFDSRDINQCLRYDSHTEHHLGDFDAIEKLFHYITKTYDNGDDPVEESRMLEMALRLFLHLAVAKDTNRAFDPRVNGLSHTDMFAAALDTAIIWERG